MKKIDLKAILAKHEYLVRVETDSSLIENPALRAMKEVWNTAVDECSKIIDNHTKNNCSNHTPYWGACGSCGVINNYEVLSSPADVKESIEQVKQMIC